MEQQMLMQPVEAAELAAVNGGLDLSPLVAEFWHRITDKGIVINSN
jgi:hypothetical protein